jgi:hypothetical protein
MRITFFVRCEFRYPEHISHGCVRLLEIDSLRSVANSTTPLYTFSQLGGLAKRIPLFSNHSIGHYRLTGAKRSSANSRYRSFMARADQTHSSTVTP